MSQHPRGAIVALADLAAGSSPVSPTSSAVPICRDSVPGSAPQQNERAQKEGVWRYYPLDECTGVKGYPPEWHATIKHAVREQAGHRCVRCLHPYVKGAGAWSPCDLHCTHGGPYRYEWNGIWEDADEGQPAGITALLIAPRKVEAAWRILTVHHLDGDKGNCRWWNLAALCQRCHLEIQGKVRMDRRWLREHSAWFQPYVAGYYAWTFLGEDLTREQVEARLPELLALEDRQLDLVTLPLERATVDRGEERRDA